MDLRTALLDVKRRRGGEGFGGKGDHWVCTSSTGKDFSCGREDVMFAGKVKKNCQGKKGP